MLEKKGVKQICLMKNWKELQHVKPLPAEQTVA